MNWQEHLAEEARRRAERRDRARQRTEERRKIQAALVRAFLPRLGEALKQAGDTFNQSAKEKIRVTGPQRGDGGERVDIAVNGRGFAFQDSGKGFVRVIQVTPDGGEAYAYLQPQLNRAGDLVGWQEKQIFPGGKTLGRNIDSITEYYILQLIRAHLRQG